MAYTNKEKRNANVRQRQSELKKDPEFLEKRKEQFSNWYNNNKEKHLQQKAKYRLENKDKILVARKRWCELNPHWYRDYERMRKSTDPIFKSSSNLRDRIRGAFKNKGWKRGHSADLLGCSCEELKDHLQQQFTKGMTWENYGQWHIDHIIPLASAKTEDDLIKLCHYTNLQPLWAIDNLKKGSRVQAY